MILKFSVETIFLHLVRLRCWAQRSIFGHPAETCISATALETGRKLGALARPEGSAFFAGVSKIITMHKIRYQRPLEAATEMRSPILSVMIPETPLSVRQAISSLSSMVHAIKESRSMPAFCPAGSELIWFCDGWHDAILPSHP